MKITKLGHCCLLIETKGKGILTDPGIFTVEAHSKLENIDYILYTHEHQDHYHLESLKVLLKKNPKVVVYANNSVSDLLDKEDIKHVKIENGESVSLGKISVMGIGEKHAEIHSSIPLSANIGFLIDGKLWYPGDAFTDPLRAVEILALPVAGPWMKIGEAVDYALLIKPKIAFPVHDAMGSSGMMGPLFKKILDTKKITFVPMNAGDVKEF